VSHQAQVRFVDNLRTLQRVIGTLAGEVIAGQATKFVIYEGDQRFFGGNFAATPAPQQFGHFSGRGGTQQLPPVAAGQTSGARGI
jgi:hypothetical protein